MPATRLNAKQVLRFKTQKRAAEIFASIPEGYAFRDGIEIHILRPLNLTFSPAGKSPVVPITR